MALRWNEYVSMGGSNNEEADNFDGRADTDGQCDRLPLLQLALAGCRVSRPARGDDCRPVRSVRHLRPVHHGPGDLPSS